MAKSTPQKMPLQVATKLTPKRGNVPFQLTYEDETTEIINPVKGIKLVDGAVRWKCSIYGREVELFNEGENWWTMQ